MDKWTRILDWINCGFCPPSLPLKTSGPEGREKLLFQGKVPAEAGGEKNIRAMNNPKILTRSIE